MTRYEHTQVGHFLIWGLLSVTVVMVTIGAMISALLIPFVVAVVVLLTVAAFYKLTIKIDDQSLLASFGPGLIKKETRLAEIVACEPIRIRWWYGWGIHLTPYGWLYNISGWDAVPSPCATGGGSRWELTILTDLPTRFAASFPRNSIRCRRQDDPSRLHFQRTKPAQRGDSFHILDFMAAVKNLDSNTLEAGSLDRTHDTVLLIQRCNLVIASTANENWSY